MTHDEFLIKCKEPVDIEEARMAFRRFINGEVRLLIPASPYDDDMLISRALDELEECRKKVALLEEVTSEDCCCK